MVPLQRPHPAPSPLSARPLPAPWGRRPHRCRRNRKRRRGRRSSSPRGGRPGAAGLHAAPAALPVAQLLGQRRARGDARQLPLHEKGHPPPRLEHGVRGFDTADAGVGCLQPGGDEAVIPIIPFHDHQHRPTGDAPPVLRQHRYDLDMHVAQRTIRFPGKHSWIPSPNWMTHNRTGGPSRGPWTQTGVVYSW